MDLTPAALRDVRFTERFRGYDAAEVDAFLAGAAEALEELLAEHSAPMAAVASARAREAIARIREETLGAVEELQERRSRLEQATDNLQQLLKDRRRALVEALELIDSAIDRQGTPAGPGAGPQPGPARSDGGSGGGGGDGFLARLEMAVAGTEDSGASRDPVELPTRGEQAQGNQAGPG